MTAPRIAWPLLPLPDAHGCLQWPTLEQSVREAMQVILLTNPGELLMHPEFGGGLHEFLREPNTLATRRRIRDRVQAALERWEPRIDVDRVEVAEDPDRATDARVEIAYRVRRTGVAAQLGISVALEE